MVARGIRGWLQQWFAPAATVPARHYILNFSLPPLQNKLNRPQLNPRGLMQQWAEYAHHPQALAEQSLHYLHQLNRYRVPAHKRLVLLDIVAKPCAVLLADGIQRARNAEGLRENSARREMLTRLQMLAQALVSGYLQVFQQDYLLPEPRYHQVRSRMPVVGGRIMELIRSLQLLYALRYVKLPGEYWQAANQVYFVLSEYETVDRPAPLLGCLRALPRGTEAQDGACQHATVQQLYRALQLLGVMDLMTWPLHELAVLEAYLSAIGDEISILPDEGGPLPPSHLVTSFDQDGPAGFQRRLTSPGRLINVAVLRKRLNEDHLYIFSNENSHDLRWLSAPLSQMPAHERALFVERMRARLSPRQRRDVRAAVQELRAIYVYSGFMEVHRQLARLQDPDASAAQSLSQMLAGRAMLLTDDVRVCKQDWSWRLINEGEGGVQLWAEEAGYFNALTLDRLVLYHDTTSAPDELMVGYVGRLMRPAPGHVGIALIKLGHQPLSVIMQDEALKQADQGWPAILLRGAGERWQLILHERHTPAMAAALTLRFKQQVVEVVLGGVERIQREFKVYNLLQADGLP